MVVVSICVSHLITAEGAASSALMVGLAKMESVLFSQIHALPKCNVEKTAWNSKTMSCTVVYVLAVVWKASVASKGAVFVMGQSAVLVRKLVR